MKYINQLTKEQEEELLNILGFDKFMHSSEYKVVKKVYDYYGEIEYGAYYYDGSSIRGEEEAFYLIISDFYVEKASGYYGYHHNDTIDKEATTKLRKFMSQIFGKEEYINDFIEKLNKDKEKYQERINEKIKKIDEELEEIKELQK